MKAEETVTTKGIQTVQKLRKARMIPLDMVHHTLFSISDLKDSKDYVGSLELEKQRAFSHLVWVLGTQPRPPCKNSKCS